MANLDQAVEQFSEEQKKNKIALEAANGDKVLAEKYLRGEIKNMVAVKGTFQDEAVHLYGAFIMFIHLDQKLLERIFAVVSFDQTIKSISPYAKWSELERKIIDFDWGDKSLKNQSNELRTGIQSTVIYDKMDQITKNIKDLDGNELKNIFNEVICSSLGLTSITVDTSIEMLNRYLINLESPDKQVKPQASNSEEGQFDAEEKEIMFDGHLVIAPIRGLSITKLHEGMDIFVKLPDKTSKDRHFLQLFNAIVDEKVQPVQVCVRTIDYDPEIGYIIISDIMPGFIVRCIEQAQINILTPVGVEDNEPKGKKTVLVIAAIGGLLLLFSGLYMVLLVKGLI